MKSIRLAITACALVVSSFGTHAQGLEALSGTWYGHGQLPGGLALELELRVEGAAGSWQQMPRGKPAVPNPCLGRQHPVAVAQSAPGQYKVHVQASKTVAGCQDARLNLNLVDSTHIDGTFGDGRAFKLERR